MWLREEEERAGTCEKERLAWEGVRKEGSTEGNKGKGEDAENLESRDEWGEINTAESRTETSG